MKFKKLKIILVVFVLLLIFSCVTVSAADVKLTWSSISVPGDAHTEAMKVFKEEVEKLSVGHITVDLYIAGAIYTQEGELAAVREGTLDMAYYSDAWLAEFVPYLSMIGAVYTFSGFNHMDRVLNGEIGKRIFDEVAQKTGVRPLAAFYLGTRQLNVVEKVGPVRTPEDMKGVKLRTPASPAWIALGKALGGNPTPMSFGEVYMGLKTGTIEGQDNPLPTDKNAKFYEVTKYIILTDHVVNSVWPTINEKKWQSLNKVDQLIIRIAIEKAREFCAETNLKAEAEILDFFREQGLIIIEDPDKEAFAEYAKWSYQNESKEISKDWDMELYEEIQALK
ncbi:DctP family TRAP transporter solute-binding subunit [Candidatus Atribacteria bacterium 1244-E10-H5-B2]|nr:MAG: DctP family TRAP transporter solute-binding subunit [Candidatus Atribacteria bacterium 1244-E10-H5-B2]